MPSEATRKEIAILLRAGTSTCDIMEVTKASRATMFRVKKRLKDGKEMTEKPRTGRPAKLDLGDVTDAFKANLGLKMIEFAKERDVNTSTVSEAVKSCVEGPSQRPRIRPLS